MTKPIFTAKTNAGLPVIIASITVLILILGGLLWHNFGNSGGGEPARSLTAQEKADREFVQKKAAESSGNFNSLSQEDQQRLLAIIGQRAPFQLKQEALNLKRNP